MAIKMYPKNCHKYPQKPWDKLLLLLQFASFCWDWKGESCSPGKWGPEGAFQAGQRRLQRSLGDSAVWRRERSVGGEEMRLPRGQAEEHRCPFALFQGVDGCLLLNPWFSNISVFEKSSRLG